MAEAQVPMEILFSEVVNCRGSAVRSITRADGRRFKRGNVHGVWVKACQISGRGERQWRWVVVNGSTPSRKGLLSGEHGSQLSHRS